MRRMDGEMRQIKKERLILVAPYEIHRFISQEIGEVSALGILHGRVRHELEMCARTFYGFVESSLRRVIFWLQPEMPFAEHGRGIPGLLQALGYCNLIERQFRDVVHGTKRTTAPIKTVNAPDGIDARAGHVLAAHQRGASWLAIGAASLAAAEADAFRGQTVY